MLKLVLDTNTIISGFLWKGKEFELLQEIEKNEVMMFLTKETFAEL